MDWIVIRTQTVAVLRIVLPAALAFAVGKGWVRGADVSGIAEAVIDVVAAAITFAAAVWSALSHRPSSEIERTASLKAVSQVVVDRHYASPHPKVVT